jgi:hypothetical protein
MTETNPTAAEFAAMLAEHDAALRAFDDLEDDDEQESRVRARFATAETAILTARPSDPAVLAAQLRWLNRERQEGSLWPDRPLPGFIG